ncbi:hypothetical protein L3Y34_012958 [Caenorhabditis briggsae]|uniref:Uncharacterized protein n=1 Tax=Caenorhabditis briggsae TaxID=6238 RepID=A0AAE8ZSM1_CAEBR|nr:hypothetical protein L3Y34_012958 [Caenorhabditis briggsae]
MFHLAKWLNTGLEIMTLISLPNQGHHDVLLDEKGINYRKSIGISPGTKDQQRIRGIPAVGLAPQVPAGPHTNNMLPSWLLFSHLWNQPNENLTEDEGSAYSSSTTPSSSSTFVGVSAGGNKNIQKFQLIEGPAQRSSEHIKRLLLDKRNRQKAKLTPKPAFLPGTAKCEQRHEEAIKHHQSSPVQNDIFLANLTSLNLFHPLVPNRAMPQEVPFRACNDMDLFCAWRQERCAISSRNARTITSTSSRSTVDVSSIAMCCEFLKPLSRLQVELR